MAPIRLVVEMDDGEPISGRLGPLGKEGVPFAGLLELIAALDRARIGEKAADGRQDESSDSG